MRRRRAGTHEVRKLVVLVAVVVGAILPKWRRRIVRQDPGTAGVNSLADDAEASNQLVALQFQVADNLLDLAA